MIIHFCQSPITFPHCCSYNVATQYIKNGTHIQNTRRPVRPQLPDSESTEIKRKSEEQRQSRKVSILIAPAIPSLRPADEQYSSSDVRAYVLKPVSPSNWEQAQNISRDLRSSQFVRLPVDSITDELILVYPYFTEDLMSFVKNHEIPIAQTKWILLNVLKGLKEFHDNDWVHTGVNQAHLSARVLCDR